MELLACAGFAWGVGEPDRRDIARLRHAVRGVREALEPGDVTAAPAAGADFSTIVVMAGGNRELQPLVDLVVTRSMRMLRARRPEVTCGSRGSRVPATSSSCSSRANAGGAAARYRQIYRDYRAVVEDALWHQRP